MGDRLAIELRSKMGSQVKAAKRLGVSQGFVSKLLNGRIEKLGSDTFGQLAEWLPVEELHRVVQTPLQAALRHQYERWLLNRMREAEKAPEPVGKAVRRLREDPRYAACLKPLEKMAAARWGCAGTNGREAQLVLAVEGRTVAVWERLALAEYRAVAPLVQGHASAGVERTLEELHEADQLEPYLRAMVRAERILLDRRPAAERVQEQQRQRRQRQRRKQ